MSCSAQGEVGERAQFLGSVPYRTSTYAKATCELVGKFLPLLLDFGGVPSERPILIPGSTPTPTVRHLCLHHGRLGQKEREGNQSRQEK